MKSIAVLGPGGVGGFVAAALAHADEDVTVVASEQTAERIGQEGIQVRSVRLGDFVAAPAATAALREPVDALLVATKATTLRAALARVQAQPKLVVPLLNGIDHMSVLRERFGAGCVAAGSIRIESDRPRPATVVQTSPFLRVDLAADERSQLPALHQLANLLDRAQIPTRVGSSEAQVLWVKLVRLNALACTTSAADRPIGFIRSDPAWRARLVSAIEEGAAVARAEGAEIDPAAPLRELEEAHPELGSSMQRDIAGGREPELDAIAGAVLRAAARHGVEAPTITELSKQVARRAGTPPPRVLA